MTVGKGNWGHPCVTQQLCLPGHHHCLFTAMSHKMCKSQENRKGKSKYSALSDSLCPYRGNCQVKSCICQHFLWNSYQSQIIQSLFRAVFPSHKDTSTLHPVWFVPMELSLAFFLDFDQGTQKLCAFPLVFNCFYSSFS